MKTNFSRACVYTSTCLIEQKPTKFLVLNSFLKMCDLISNHFHYFDSQAFLPIWQQKTPSTDELDKSDWKLQCQNSKREWKVTIQWIKNEKNFHDFISDPVYRRERKREEKTWDKSDYVRVNLPRHWNRTDRVYRNTLVYFHELFMKRTLYSSYGSKILLISKFSNGNMGHWSRVNVSLANTHGVRTDITNFWLYIVCLLFLCLTLRSVLFW